MNMIGSLRFHARFYNMKMRYTYSWLLILVLVVIGQSNKVQAQVIAKFSVNDSVGCDFLVATFINESEGSGLTYFWDFGNNQYSNEKDPQVVFNISGRYTIKLVVSNGVDSDSLLRVDYIKVFTSPKASFETASERTGCSPLSISFINSSTLGDGPLDMNVWDFGDGHSSNENGPTYNYLQTGFFDVSLYVKDTNGCESNISQSNFIHVTQKPIAKFTSSVSTSCTDTLTVTFSNKSFGTTDLNFAWDFGDNAVSQLENPVHFYSGFNNYTVQLKVADLYGCTDSVTIYGYVQIQQLIPNFIIQDDTLCKNQNLEIQNNTSGATGFRWIFGDGTTSVLPEPIKNYVDTGAFEIEVISSFQNTCFDTTLIPVYIDPVTAKFESNEHYICQLPSTVIYTNLSANYINWHWGFGNTGVSSHENPVVVYEMTHQLRKDYIAYYSDTLIVESEWGCTDTAVIDSNIYINIPYVTFSPNDSGVYANLVKGCFPLTVDFKNNSHANNPDDPLIGWFWDFDDENTSTSFQTSHTFTGPGTYQASLKAVSQSGCTNYAYATIKAGSPQTAKFSYQDSVLVCGSEMVDFTDQSTDSMLIDQWYWFFSDGTVSHNQDPQVQFVDTGYISASLTVFYNGCTGTTYFEDSLLYVVGPAGTFTQAMTCENPYLYTFTTDLKGADNWYWDFGDGTYDSTQTLVCSHTYNHSENYKVVLTGKNNSTDCKLEVNKTVFARNIVSDFNYSPEYNCVNNLITFDPSPSMDEYFFSYNNKLTKYLWSFDDTSELIPSSRPITHQFKTNGDHLVKLLVYDINKCFDEIEKVVHLNAIEADFSIGSTQGCAPFQVSFTDHSTADTQVVSWNWSFGDGQSSTQQNPIIVYNSQGNFEVNLIIKDVLGCADTLTKEGAVTSLKPYVNFQAIRNNSCFGDSVFFLSDSLGSIRSFYWDFGDGQSDTLPNPVHFYQDTGYYQVSLMVTDSLGCDSTLVKDNYIFIQPLPVADFIANNTFSTCYPSIIGFEDISTIPDLNHLVWDFGDEVLLENIQQPFHTYKEPGIFDVKLTIKSSIGCTDSMIKTDYINIGGPYAQIFAPDSFCVNLPAIITFADSFNIHTFEWTDDEGSIFTTDTILKTYQTPGTKFLYLLLKNDDFGTCDKIISDSIIIPELKTNFSTTDTAGCVPLSVHFLNQSVGATSINWYSNQQYLANQPEFDYQFSTPGLYKIQLMIGNGIGCNDSLMKNIVVYPLPTIQISNDTLICQYDTILLQASGGIAYKWSANQTVLDSLTDFLWVSPLATQPFFVNVSDTNNCGNIDSVMVEVQPKPLINVLNNDTISLIVGEEVLLQATQEFGDYFFWSPDESLTCGICLTPFAKPMHSLTYFFTVEDKNQCFSIADSVYISVDEKYSVNLPNSFTPNNDGINDIIYVKGWGIKELKSFKVYTKQGKLVFESRDINEGWDGGSFLGEQPPGLYLYKVEVLSFDNQVRAKEGYFFLME